MAKEISVNSRIQSLLGSLDDYKGTAPGISLKLRLSLAEILQSNMKSRGWTQRKLADKTNKKEAYISRVMHSEANCTLDTIAELLFALDVRAKLQQEILIAVSGEQATGGTLRVLRQDGTYGEEISLQEAITDQEDSSVFRDESTTYCGG